MKFLFSSLVLALASAFPCDVSLAGVQDDIANLKKLVAMQQAEIADLRTAKVFTSGLSKGFTCPTNVWTKIPVDEVLTNTMDARLDSNAFVAPKSGFYSIAASASADGAGTNERYGYGVTVNNVLQGLSGGSATAVDTPLSSYSQVLYLNAGDKAELMMYCAVTLKVRGKYANGHDLRWNIVFIGK